MPDETPVTAMRLSFQFSLAEILKINFYGLRRLTLGLIPKLNQGASIVNIASGAGSGWLANIDANRLFLGLEDQDQIHRAIETHELHNDGMSSKAVYPFSKELLITWTLRDCTAWLDRGIRMNAVSPGATETPILGDFMTNFGDVAKNRTAAFGFGQPDQIADVIIFLLSHQSRWINGANIPVDGGIVAAATSNKLNL